MLMAGHGKIYKGSANTPQGFFVMKLWKKIRWSLNPETNTQSSG